MNEDRLDKLRHDAIRGDIDCINELYRIARQAQPRSRKRDSEDFVLETAKKLLHDMGGSVDGNFPPGFHRKLMSLINIDAQTLHQHIRSPRFTVALLVGGSSDQET